MKKYPTEVITKNRRGKLEIRNLVARGKFVIYDYRDPETMKNVENNKQKLYLMDSNNKKRGFFIIPLKENKNLLIEAIEDKHPERKVWNNIKKKAENLF